MGIDDVPPAKGDIAEPDDSDDDSTGGSGGTGGSYSHVPLAERSRIIEG
jgi:hypothetical protein